MILQRTQLLLGLFLVLGISSCKKDVAIPQAPTNPTSSGTYIPMTVGSYWIYDWYDVDTLGNTTPLNVTDSISVSGDTIIGLNTFYVMEEFWHNQIIPARKFYRRDSCGSLIDTSGNVYFSSTNLTDTLFIGYETSSELGYYKMTDINKMVTAPAGTFSTMNAAFIFVNLLGTWPCWGKFYVSDKQYAKNVGKVRQSFIFNGPNGPICFIHDRRLRTYHIN